MPLKIFYKTNNSQRNFSYQPMQEQFNFNLSKYKALNIEIIKEIPKIRAIKIIKVAGEELRKFIPINNSQKV